MATRQKILARIEADIARCGQSVMFVGDGQDSFHYTIGRGRRGLPELLILCPLHPESGQRLLNALDERMA